MYDIFYVSVNETDTYKQLKEKYPLMRRVASYEDARKKTFTKMFWLVWDDIRVLDDFNFSYQVPEWDQQYIHVFKNGDYFDGICLFPKSREVSNREFDNRFFINKKEVDECASVPLPYDRFVIESYEDYLNAKEQSTTNMFWAVFSDLEVLEDFKFNYHVPAYNQNITHVFKNDELYDGVCLFSKKLVLSKREFDYRFFTVKKEVDIQSSITAPIDYDIVFISYFEPNADTYYEMLQKKVGRPVYRVDGVKGIHNAHKQAASLAQTEMFWVVDGDAIIVDEFNFDYRVSALNKTTVHVWRSRNPINNMEYGYGGVKLLPRHLTLAVDTNAPDMTTSISGKFKSLDQVSNITAFNVDPFSTWRSAFRECCKLASKTIQGQVAIETEERLNIWCTVGADSKYGKYAIEGALAGKEYGQKNASNPEALRKINDFEWLKSQFEQTHLPLGISL